MTRSVVVLLQDILDSIGQIEEYTAGLTKERFAGKMIVQDAVVRRLEIIGEAVKGLPSELRDSHPEIPWKQIAGARDVLSHEYFRVDLDLTWQMVSADLPDLKTKLSAILAGMMLH